MAKRTPKAPTVSRAELLAGFSGAVQITAMLAKQFHAAGKCDPKLYDSLKALQLELDRTTRAAMKKGEKVSPEMLLGLEELTNDLDELEKTPSILPMLRG